MKYEFINNYKAAFGLIHYPAFLFILMYLFSVALDSVIADQSERSPSAV